MGNSVRCILLEQEIETEVNSDLLKLKINKYYDTRKYYLKIKRKRQLNAICSLKDKQTKTNDRIVDCEKNLRTKMLIDFDHSVAWSMKLLAVQKATDVKPAFRFFNGKILMAAKVPLISFVYDMIETTFLISFVYETDSTFMMILFICKVGSSKKEDGFIDLVLEIITKSGVKERLPPVLGQLDESNQFWERFGVQN